MLSGRGSGLRTPTMPPQQSARCSRSAGDGAADGGGRDEARPSRCGRDCVGRLGADMRFLVYYEPMKEVETT